jgi:small-conductance mechanosensitive channel
MSQSTLPIGEEIAKSWSALTLWLTGHSTQIAMAALVGAVIVALLYAVKLLGIWLCRADHRVGHWPGIIGQALAKTRVWFMVSVAAQIISVFAHAPADIATPVHMLFIVAAVLQAAVWVRAIILGIVEYRAAEADPSGSLGSAVGIIRLLVTVTLFALAIILILANLGVDVTGLLAGLGIGGIAIGLAAQGIFSDLFAALSILFDKPFRRGDIIRWETGAGTVEAIGLKSTRIRALTGEELVVSNANLLGKELRNFARLDTRRIVQTLSLVYQLPPDTCAALPTLLRDVVDACDGCHFIRCGLDSFAASSLDFQLIYDIEAQEQEQVLALKHAVNVAILSRFAAEKIAFAYPTQTTFTAAPDGVLVMPYAQLPVAPLA